MKNFNTIFYYPANNINQTATTYSSADVKTKIRRNSSGLFLLN